MRAGRNDRTSGRRTSDRAARAAARGAPPRGGLARRRAVRRARDATTRAGAGSRNARAHAPPAEDPAARRDASRRRGSSIRRYAASRRYRTRCGTSPPGIPRTGGASRSDEAQVEIPVLVRVERLVEAADALERARRISVADVNIAQIAGERARRTCRAAAPCVNDAFWAAVCSGNGAAVLVDDLRRAVDERASGAAASASTRHVVLPGSIRSSESRKPRYSPSLRPRPRSRPAAAFRPPANRAHRVAELRERLHRAVARAGVDDDHLQRRLRCGEHGAHRVDQEPPRSRVGMMTLTPLDIRGRTSLRARCVR